MAMTMAAEEQNLGLSERTRYKKKKGTCMIAPQFIVAVKSEEKNIHDQKFADSKNPLAVPIIVPEVQRESVKECGLRIVLEGKRKQD